MVRKLLIDLYSSFEFERLHKAKISSKKDVIKDNKKYVEYTMTNEGV